MDVDYESVLALVDQLSPTEQTQLTAHLLEMAQKRTLSTAEKMRLLRSVQVKPVIIKEPSMRREDWYGEDGKFSDPFDD
jgi:hypothetical protein